MRISRRIKAMAPSQTVAITDKAKKLRASGVDVVALSLGEPDFDTPQHIKDAAVAAIEAGCGHYTPNAGLPELRQAICDKLRRDNGLEYKPENVIVSSGAKQSLYNALQALLDPGDEVVIPAPYWVTYPELVKLSGGVPVEVLAEDDAGFKMTPQQLDAACTDKTAAVIINSPSNPTGAVYTADELTALGEVCLRRGLTVIADEIYEKIIYDEAHASVAALLPKLKPQVVTVNGISKAYAMTGWRLGYVAGHSDLIKAMSKLQGQITFHPAAVTQHATLAALNGPEDDVVAMREEFRARRDYVVGRLSAMPGFSCLMPGGAFYAFPRISGVFGRKTGAGRALDGSPAVCEAILDEAHVALVPGSAFGAPDYLRLSYAAARQRLETALDRIENWLATLS